MKGGIRARLGWRNGRTRLLESKHCAPFKIARAFEWEDGGLEICVMDASPGLLSGDEARFDWELEAGARVRITAQGATRVHPSRGATALLQTRARVAAGARLELWPQSIIPFGGARLHSRTEIELQAGAQLCLFESLSAGRIARGERFAFESVELQTHLRDARGPLLLTRNRFAPAQLSPDGPASWNGATQWSSLVAIGAPADSDAATAIAAARQTIAAHPVCGGVSTLARGGLIAALLGARACDGRAAAWEIARKWRAVSRETPSL